MFSRFDNMMQHTQTHNKSRNGPRRNSKPKSGKRGNKKTSRRSSMMDDYEDYALPSPPPSRRGSSHNIIKEHQIIMPNPKYVEVDEDDDDDDDDMFMDDDQPSSGYQGYYCSQSAPMHSNMDYSPYNNYYPPPYQQKHYAAPDSPTSSDSLSMQIHDYFPTPSRRRSAPQVRYQPYPYHSPNVKEQQEMSFIPRRNSVLSQLATYLVDHPDKSPENFLSHHQKQNMPTRRLSIQDLSNPIEHLDESGSTMSTSTSSSSISSHHSADDELDGVDLTEDEFQAIQGFGKFYRTAITCNK
ncbi:hypothetical protein BD560DRAFT_77647 [Blakeslea trispora]|nr:hypothetical protein BD560DRAFT_77647 [Blakeslea trispora]